MTSMEQTGGGGSVWVLTQFVQRMVLSIARLGLIISAPCVPIASAATTYVVLDAPCCSNGRLVRVSLDGSVVTPIADVFGTGLVEETNGDFVIASVDALRRVTRSGQVSLITTAPAGSHWVSIALDKAGNFIVGDNLQHAIWRISPDGSTAKTLVAHYPILNPSELEDVSIVVDTAGNYIVASQNGRVLELIRMAPNGAVTRIPVPGITVDSGLEIAQAANGNLLLGTFYKIFSIDPSGSATLIVQSDGLCCNFSGLARDADTGDVLATFRFGGLLKVSKDGSITTVAGGMNFAGPAGVVIDNLVITGLKITNASPLVSGTTGVGYSQTLTAIGGISPYTWSFASGTLPPGLTLSSSGTISGIPTVPGTSTFTVRVTDSASSSASQNMGLTIGSSLPVVSTLINGASLQPGAVSPGEIVSFFGSGMGPVTGVSFDLVNGKLPTTLAGVTVSFNGVAAPLLYVSSTQINAIVPYEMADLVAASVVVTYANSSSSEFQTRVTDTAPAIFSLSQGGSGQGAILNQNDSLNGSNNPAALGTVVQIFGTGEGKVLPAAATGSITPATPPFPAPIAKVSVTIGGQPAQVTYAGEAPSLISGLFQVNAVVPGSIGSGPQAVVLSIGDKSNIQQNITLMAGNPVPSIISLSPSSATAGDPPLSVAINGTYFLSSSIVTFNGTPHAASLTGPGQLTITLSSADLATAGSFSIVVTNPAPGGGMSNAVVFVVRPTASNPQPVITSLSQSSAIAGSAPITLTINGSGFIASSSVSFNGVSHPPSLLNANQLTITLGQLDLATPGTFSVVVTNPQPGGGSSAPASFVVQSPAAPTLRSLAINGGTLAGGTVNLTGGTSTTGTVGLSGAAPSGGMQISLSSSNPSLQVPATVNVAAGQSSANFMITTVAVSSAQAVTITATLEAVRLTANLTVIPATPASPFQNSSFDIYGTLNISGQSVPVELQTLALADGTLGTLSNSGGSMINLTILFNQQSSTSGNTLTYAGADPSSFFINTSTSAFYFSITSATLSITIQSPTVGAAVTGTFKFTSSGTTLNGTITGAIKSVSGR